jgi:two-component system sensor histidine kinase KdpD
MLNRRLATARGLDNLLRIIIHYITEVFESEAVFLLPNQENQLEIFSDQHAKVILTAKEQSVAQWVFELGQIAGLGTNTLPESEAIYIPLLGHHEHVGVLRVLPKEVARLRNPEQLHLLERIATQIALVIEVERLAEPVKNPR